jgi:hypothetical protein
LNDRWQALVSYDNEISAAVEKLRPFGDSWVDKLGSAFFALKEDRRYLANIVQTLIDEAKQEAAVSWVTRFRQTMEGELCTEESLNLLREAEAVGYTLTVDNKHMFTLAKGSAATYLRSNSDIRRIVPVLIRSTKKSP